MKKIKLILTYLFIVSLAFAGCNNDDTNNNSNNIDPIIGKWKTIELNENGIKQKIAECELQNTIEYLNDGKIIDTYFEPNSNNGCDKIVDNSGSWKKISDLEYQIILDDGDVNYISPISFSKNNTVHVQKFTIQDGEEKSEQLNKYQKIE
ncbi:lipocalin-like domain-containing protein [Aquimarina agarilytica]|uniref:lipocalin family protein n=1 Tax=Aquimarina agarilytica TaxID=1087449 RepID=UPI0002881665|nr:lipocalin family protein [Aquimarina agarilytica]